jgi:hypothetical protein
MKTRIAARKREALGRLAQVIACADRALSRDVTCPEDGDDADTDVCVRESARQESVEPSRNALSNAAGKGLLLRIV